jgi:flagellar motor switch protein FliN
MTISDDLRARDDVVVAFAAALEHELGNDALITIGVARASVSDVITDDQVRAVAMHFGAGDGGEGTLGLVASAHFAETLASAASDELLLTSVTPALDAAAQALAGFGIEVEPDTPAEATLAAMTHAFGNDDIVAYPLLVGTDVVACLVVGVGATESEGATASAATAGTQAAIDAINEALPAPAAPSNVLADVEMGVTAELGRCNMTVRELLSLTPGAVIDLDRAAGAPVDVLVNGTLIARGEVVVVDEEFGIRIAEILRNGSPAR